ncbi:MAG: glycosyltransferase family 4 protein [Bacteroidetes bacterium]|nr:glycosyltransferase family 4 protein [Bacteroidota bacterium]
MTYRRAKLKLALERILIFPFMLAGKIYGRFAPLKKKTKLFLFFPNADIGGAPRVNADITHCIRDLSPLIIFSKKASNNQFLPLFKKEDVPILDLHRLIDHKAFHFINFFYRGVLASWINQAENPIVFGGESIFFYKVIPHIRRNIPCIELSHLDTWLPYNIGFADRIQLRIFSTQHLLEKVALQYKENHLQEDFFKKLIFIDNAIDIPSYAPIENEMLEVVFIGRGSSQKRVHLIAAIAKILRDQNEKIHFTFVGNVEECIKIADYPYCCFTGNIHDEEKMKDIYSKSDVLILTSAFEGLPLVVMTMMAYGKTVVSTAVNAIPDYIFHEKNGLLIEDKEENKIVERGVQYLKFLNQHRSLLNSYGENSRLMAIEKFSKETFCKNYRKLLAGSSS